MARLNMFCSAYAQDHVISFVFANPTFFDVPKLYVFRIFI